MGRRCWIGSASPRPGGPGSRRQGHAPSEVFATEVVRCALARRAARAAPRRETALVGQEGQIAGVLGRVTVPTVAGAVAMDPVLAGAARGRRWRPQDRSGE